MRNATALYSYRSCCSRSTRRWRSYQRFIKSQFTANDIDDRLPGVAASHADDADGGAGDADRDVDVLEDDADGGQDGRDAQAVGRLNRLAALECAGRAGAGLGRRAGDGKDCKRGERGESSGGLGEHVVGE